ncbi:MAG: hypothetical protein PVG41_01370 [Desulfobacteraceae bacterium]
MDPTYAALRALEDASGSNTITALSGTKSTIYLLVRECTVGIDAWLPVGQSIVNTGCRMLQRRRRVEVRL